MFYLMTHSTHFIYGYMEGRKEMFYLTTHSTHFIYSYMEGRKEMFYLTTHSTHFIYVYILIKKAFLNLISPLIKNGIPFTVVQLKHLT